MASAGQLHASRQAEANRARRIVCTLTPQEKTIRDRKDSRNFFKNSALTLAVSTVLIPVTGGATAFLARPALMATFEASLDVISTHVDIP